MTIPRPPHIRALTRIEKVDGGCWIYTGELSKRGYGNVYVKTGPDKWVPRRAHRVVYEGLVGPIPDGLTIDHLCFNKACVNPDHLEPVTRAENARRQWDAGLAHSERITTHCRKGHELTPENTYVVRRRSERRCATCEKARLKAFYARKTGRHLDT